MESSPEWYSRDDWQLINSDRSYEGSKYEIDLIGHRLARQALQQKGGAPIVRHFTVHPGIAESNMARNLVGGFLDAIKLLVFYFVRFLNPFIPFHC